MTEILTESFCERCGTRYTFESARPRVRLKGVRVLSRGLKNFVLSDSTSMDEAMAAARSETDRDSTAHQLDAFHKTFNFCMSCRQYTCPNCWNDAEARCLTCAPLALPEAPAFDDVGAFRDAIQLGEATLIGEVAQTNGLPDHDHEQEAPTAPFLAESSVVEPTSWLEAPAPAEELELAEPGVAEATPVALVADDATPGADAWSDDGLPTAPSDAAAGKAAAQTTGLLQRFRPGQSLDDALAAFERERSDAEAPVEQDEIAASGAMEPTPEPELEPVLVDAATAADAAEPEAVAEPIGAVGAEASPEPAPEEIAAPEAPAIQPEADVPAQTPVAVPEAEPEPLAAASAEDVVEQPTWRITAPDPTAPTAPRLPTGGDAGVPLQASGASPAPGREPQWPAKPQWPGSTPAAGLPFLGRPAAPEGGIDALWAASNQELVTAAPAPQSKAASGIQPCISCGLSLSANARFCRRCGTLQGR